MTELSRVSCIRYSLSSGHKVNVTYTLENSVTGKKLWGKEDASVILDTAFFAISRKHIVKKEVRFFTSPKK